MKQFGSSSFSRALVVATCGTLWACGGAGDEGAATAAQPAQPSQNVDVSVNVNTPTPAQPAVPLGTDVIQEPASVHPEQAADAVSVDVMAKDPVDGEAPGDDPENPSKTDEPEGDGTGGATSNPGAPNGDMKEDLDVVDCDVSGSGVVQEWMSEPIDLPWGGYVAMSPEGNGLELTHVDFSTSFVPVPSAGPCDETILTPDQLMHALLVFNERSNELFFGDDLPDLEEENWVGKALADHYLREMVSGMIAQSYLDLRAEYADAFFVKMENPNAITALDEIRDSLEDDDPGKAFLDVILASSLNAEAIASKDDKAQKTAERAGNRHANLAAALALLLEGGTRTQNKYKQDDGDDPRDTPPWVIYGEEIDDGLNYEIASKFYRVEAMSLTAGDLKEELLFQGNSILTLPNHRENYGVQYFKQFGGTASDGLTDYNPPLRSYPKADPVNDYPWYHHIPGDQDWATYQLVGQFMEEDLGKAEKWRERLKVASNLIKKGLEKAGDAAVGYITGGALGSAGSLIGGAVGLSDTKIQEQVDKLEEQINKQYDKKKDETIEDITEFIIDNLASLLGDDPLSPEMKYKCRVKDLKTGSPRYFCYSQHDTYFDGDYDKDKFYKEKGSPFRFYSYHYYDEVDAQDGKKSDADYRAVVDIILRDAQSRWPAPGFRGDKGQLGADPDRQKLFDTKVELTVPDSAR